YVDLVKQEVEGLDEERVEDKVDLLYEVIRVYREEMNHDRMAINIYKDVLAIAPEDLDAIGQLIELYGSMNMSSDLINMLQTKAELVKGKAAKVAIHSEIAELFLEKFRNQAEAIKAYEAVLEIEPFHPKAISFLKEMYEKRRDWESLIEIHKREIETFETQEEKAAGYKEVAQLATDKLRKPDVASELWLEVRRFAPQDSDALDALETLYEKNRDYEALAEIIEQKVELSPDIDEKMKLYQKLGMLYADRLEDSDRAMAAWKGALALQPEDLKARKALERLFIDNRAWDDLEAFYAANDAYSDLVRILGTLTGTMKEDDVKIELLLRAARIWRTHLDDTNRAERELERALQIDPRNEAAAQQLEPIYEEAGNTEKLKEVLEIVLSHREDVDTRRNYQLKLAGLHRDALDDWAGAFDWFAKAFQEVPESDAVIADLEHAAGQAEQWPVVVELYERSLDRELELEDRQILRLRLGRVLSEELSSFDEALAQFEAVLADEKDNLKALASMERIFTERERWDDLMKIYRHRLELEEDRDARVQILQGMAGIAENQATDIPKAIARYTEALELDGWNKETLVQLHRLYQSEGQFDELAAIIRQEIDLVERSARLGSRKPCVVAALDLDAFLASGGSAFDGAATTSGGLFGGALSEGPDSVSEALLDLTEDSAESDDVDGEDVSLAETSEADGDEATEAPGASTLEDVQMDAHPYYTEEEIEWLAELRYELGLICMEHLDAFEEALENLGLVVTWRPNHTDAGTALEGFLEFDEYSLNAARTLEPYYEVHGQWEEYVRTLEIQVEAGGDDSEMIGLLQRIGQTHLNELGDGAKSFESYSAMLRRDPSSPHARAQLRRIASALDVWSDLVALFEEILPTIEDEELRIAYLFGLGGMYGRRLGDAEQAQSYYQQILETQPDSLQALDELEELHIGTEQWDELRGVYQQKLDLTEDSDEVEELKFRMATLWQDLLEDPDQAIAIYHEILEVSPQNVRALHEMGGLFKAQGMWQELAGN
ncbi:MAG: tetratricopeptide repeat protein, partial [Bradymonadaceae bacterium]